jgi:hypothetical protein
MVLKARRWLIHAPMSRQKKRTRIIARKEAGSRLVINEHHEIKERA